jgi:hypothetical protein
VPSTRPLLRLAGVDLVEDPADKTRRPRLIPTSLDGASLSPSAMPTQEGLDELAVEARACANINFVGTVLALATFVSSEIWDGMR